MNRNFTPTKLQDEVFMLQRTLVLLEPSVFMKINPKKWAGRGSQYGIIFPGISRGLDR